MDYSATFARHLARLVSLLLHDASNVDEQKGTLRALVALSRNGPVTLDEESLALRVNGETVPGALTGVHDVASQMSAHSIRQIVISEGSKAADLLGLARIIATGARPGDGGGQATRKLAALNPRGIVFVTPEPVPVVDAQRQAEAPTELIEAVNPPVGAAQHAAALLAELGARDVSRMTPGELLRALDSAKSADAATQVLDDLVVLAEHCVRTGQPGSVADVLHEIVLRDAQLRDGDTKRAYVLAIRRMSKPAILRSVASLILKRPAQRQALYHVLERAGEDGADAIIEQITQAPTADDRRVLVDVFRELSDAVPALKRMLGDSRWFVVRNAADLLGELTAHSAETALIGLLRHGDDRVRRAATNALLRLATPQAMKAIYEAVGDSSPEVRMQATVAIATRKDSRTSTTLIRAIEDEQDGDVQLAMIAALGKVGTPDAVQKLIKMAEPAGRLFRRKATSFRVAAVQALGDAKTPAAVNALRDLSADKDKDVRETATRALAQSGR